MKLYGVAALAGLVAIKKKIRRRRTVVAGVIIRALPVEDMMNGPRNAGPRNRV
jgi:hypothetical protein